MWLVKDGYRSDRVLPTLGVPVLISHGLHDNIVPVRHAYELQTMTPGSILVTYDCDHNGFPGGGNDEAYWGEIARFLRSAGILR